MKNQGTEAVTIENIIDEVAYVKAINELPEKSWVIWKLKKFYSNDELKEALKNANITVKSNMTKPKLIELVCDAIVQVLKTSQNYQKLTAQLENGEAVGW